MAEVAILEAEAGQVDERQEEVINVLHENSKIAQTGQGPLVTCSTFLGGYMLSNSLTGQAESSYMWDGAADVQRTAALLCAMLNLITVAILVVTQLCSKRTSPLSISNKKNSWRS